MRGSSSWWKRMRSDIDGKSILINCSMVRTRTPPFSWTTHLMTLTGALCGGFENRMLEKPWKGWKGQSDRPWWYPNQGVEMSRGYSYSMANQDVQQYLSIEQDAWGVRRSILVPIYKNKGDIQSCTNYRGIKLMSHTMKLWERVIEQRLRGTTQISTNQFGFMPGRSTTEAIFLIR